MSMDITIQPTRLTGTVAAIPSKSQAHRLLICAAFARQETYLRCPDTNRDIEATAQCLRALGAEITRDAGGYAVTPPGRFPRRRCCPAGTAALHCASSCLWQGLWGWMPHFRWRGGCPSAP